MGLLTDIFTDIKAFKEALNDSSDIHVEKIVSQNDWTPIRKRIEKDEGKDEFFQSWSYKILRFPILVPILLWISVLMISYVFLRVYIALYEYFYTWRGKRRKLRENLRKSKSYNEWIDNALKLDNFLKLDDWKFRKSFYYYDYKTLDVTVNNLRKFRLNNKPEELAILLQNSIKANFAGTENPIMYSRSYYGTKQLIEEYNEEVVKSLNYLIDEDSIDIHIKKNLLKAMNKNFGKTALCLSGGACFAYNHFGVVKALLENDTLPKIISGTSGGGIVAAITATRTNEELVELLKPELANKITACNESMSIYLKRFLQTGARFDSVDWARKAMWFTMGSMTFKEAYERTGKILNISTVPSDPHSPVILCNHITSPNCVIWSALLASSAVPGILNPVVLMMKDPKTGKLSPFSLGTKYKDGSLRTDIPVEALNTYFNVKFSIVSQVNPHISLFFFAPKGSVGRPVSRFKTGLRGGFIGAGLENYIKLENKKWLKLIKSLDLLPHIWDQDWSNIWLQKFSGTVTIWPKIKISDFWYILSDPTEERLSKMIRNGEISTYPKLLFINHRLNIERAISKGLQKIRKLNKAKPDKSESTESTIDQLKRTLSNSDDEYSFNTSILPAFLNDQSLQYQTGFGSGNEEDINSDDQLGFHRIGSNKSEAHQWW